MYIQRESTIIGCHHLLYITTSIILYKCVSEIIQGNKNSCSSLAVDFRKHVWRSVIFQYPAFVRWFLPTTTLSLQRDINNGWLCACDPIPGIIHIHLEEPLLQVNVQRHRKHEEARTADYEMCLIIACLNRHSSSLSIISLSIHDNGIFPFISAATIYGRR